jgi:hypothetical protein
MIVTTAKSWVIFFEFVLRNYIFINYLVNDFYYYLI